MKETYDSGDSPLGLAKCKTCGDEDGAILRLRCYDNGTAMLRIACRSCDVFKQMTRPQIQMFVLLASLGLEGLAEDAERHVAVKAVRA